MAEHILIAIGANLPDAAGRPALATCRWAVGELAGLPGLRLLACSRWYETAPVPPSGQPNYVNGAVRLAGAAEPGALLAALQGIEDRAGRVRSVPNAARTLDLDLLAIDQLVLNRTGLIVPHPRLESRAFVLAPLRDVAAEWTHPLTGRTTAEMLAATSSAGLRDLAPDDAG